MILEAVWCRKSGPLSIKRSLFLYLCYSLTYLNWNILYAELITLQLLFLFRFKLCLINQLQGFTFDYTSAVTTPWLSSSSPWGAWCRRACLVRSNAPSMLWRRTKGTRNPLRLTPFSGRAGWTVTWQLGQGCSGNGGNGRGGQEDLKPELEGGSQECAGAVSILLGRHSSQALLTDVPVSVPDKSTVRLRRAGELGKPAQHHCSPTNITPHPARHCWDSVSSKMQ